MSGFEYILNDFFETILVGVVSIIAYGIFSEFLSGRTFKQTTDAIERSVALGVNTVVGLEVLNTAISAVKSKEITIDEVKEILQIVRSS